LVAISAFWLSLRFRRRRLSDRINVIGELGALGDGAKMLSVHICRAHAYAQFASIALGSCGKN
jgi:hypothetical protein